jgi:hypothetical protein
MTSCWPKGWPCRWMTDMDGLDLRGFASATDVVVKTLNEECERLRKEVARHVRDAAHERQRANNEMGRADNALEEAHRQQNNAGILELQVAAIRPLLEKLGEYACHKYECEMNKTGTAEFQSVKCTCGLGELQAAVERHFK